MKFLTDFYWEPLMQGNKGTKFEDLVEDLLIVMFPNRSWIRTKKTHDGKKDFEIGLTDEFSFPSKYWAECKNRSSNISIDTLSPTLVMAVIEEVKGVFFFSPTRLNDNAQYYIAQFKSKTGLQFTLYEDEKLEDEILKHDAILKRYFPGVSLGNRSHYSEIVPELRYKVNLQRDVSYDYSDKRFVEKKVIKDVSLNVNETFCIDVFVSNNSSEDISVTLFLKPVEFEKHFSCLSEELKQNKWKVNVSIGNASIEFHRFTFKLEQYRPTLPLPKIYSADQSNKEVELSLGNVSCSWIISTPMIGSGRLEFIDLIQNQTLQTNKGRIFTYHGRSGTGKTRLLKETKDILITNDFRIISVDGDFQNHESSGIGVIKKIISEVTGLPQKEILTDLPNSINHHKQHRNLLTRVLYDDTFFADDYSAVIDTLVDTVGKSRIAVIIDNVQFFNEDLAVLLNGLINRTVGNESGIMLVISFNTDFVFNQTQIGMLLSRIKEMSALRNDFAYDFEVLDFSLSDAKQFVAHCIPDLREKYPETQAYTLERLGKTPLYIEQTLLFLYDRGSIRKSKDYFYVHDIDAFHALIEALPPRIEELLSLRWRFIKEQKTELDLEEGLTYIALFQQVSFSLLDKLKIKPSQIDQLVQLGILEISGTNQVVFHHQQLQTFFYQTFFTKGLSKKICRSVLKAIERLQLQDVYPAQWFIAKNTLSPLDDDAINFGLGCLFDGKVSREFKVAFSLRLFEALKNRPSINGRETSILKAFTRICDEVKAYATFSKALDVYKEVYSIVSTNQPRFQPFGDDYFHFIIRYSNSFLSLHQDSSAHDLLLKELSQMEKFKFSSESQRKRLKAAMLNRLCVTYKSANHPERAEFVGRESLEIAEELGDTSLMIKNFIDIGYVYYKDAEKRDELLNNWDAAWKLFNESEEVEIDQRRVSAYFHRSLTLLIRGEYDECQSFVEQGLLWADRKMDTFNRIKLIMVKSLILFLGKTSNNESSAVDHAQNAIDLCVRYSSNRSHWKSHYLLGKVSIDSNVKKESYLVALELLSQIITGSNLEERYLYFFEDLGMALYQLQKTNSHRVSEAIKTCIKTPSIRKSVLKILAMDEASFGVFMSSFKPKTNITDGRTSFPNP